MFHIQCPHLCFFSPSPPLTILPLQQCLQKYFVIYSCIFVMIFFLNVFFLEICYMKCWHVFLYFYFFILPLQQCMQRYSVKYSCIFVIIFFLCFPSGNMLVEVLACFFVFLFLYHAVPTMPAKIFREIQLYFCNDFLFKRFFLEIC